MDETFGVGPAHVGAKNHYYIAGMGNPGPFTQGQCRYLRGKAPAGPVEGDGGHY